MKFLGDPHGAPDGTFSLLGGAGTAAIRIIGLPEHTSDDVPTPLSRGMPPFSGIYVKGNCIELYAPGAMLEGLSLQSCSADFESISNPHAAVYSILDESKAPHIIIKQCFLRGFIGSSLVIDNGSRCAVLKSVFSDTDFMHVYAKENTVLRINGCRMGAAFPSALQLTGVQSKADLDAFHSSNFNEGDNGMASSHRSPLCVMHVPLPSAFGVFGAAPGPNLRATRLLA